MLAGKADALFLLIFFGIVVATMLFLRVGLLRQKRTVSQVEESLELSRRSIELHELTNVLLERIIRQQRELLDALRCSPPRDSTETNIRA